ADLLHSWDHYNTCFSTKTSFSAFREFMVAEALKNSPELKALDEAIYIQQRVLKAANRAFWIPTLALQGQIDNTFYKDGAGSNPPSDYPDDFNWTVAANLSLPIYQGAEVYAKRKGHLESMTKSRIEKNSASELIEQRIRANLHRAGASYAAIRQAGKAAEAAEKGLELVSEAYARGAVSISELTDAQAQAQIAEEAESDAVFNYLLTLMQVQRSAGQFDFFRNEHESYEFKQRLAKWMEQQVKAL
ncbi:TolC family protein, partial [Fibrobacterota bacterium]